MMKRFLTYLLPVFLYLLSQQVVAQHAHTEPKYNVGIVLYPDFETLDVYGPVQMWGYIPDFKLHFIAEQAGPVRSAQGTQSYAEYSFETAPKIDILLVPGGKGTMEQVQNSKLLSYLSAVHQNTTLTTSVCTGSALLAKIGALDGQRATTNKRFFYQSEMFSQNVDWVENARWVESGKIFTSSGVTAGTDMALGVIEKLYGNRWATGIASSLEYNWHDDPNKDPFSQFTNRLLTDQNGLISAMPSIGSSLEQAPSWIWLIYEALPNLDMSKISLASVNAPDDIIPLKGLHTMGSNDLMIGIDEQLAPGEYQIRWKTQLPQDKAPREGQYSFKVIQKQQ